MGTFDQMCYGDVHSHLPWSVCAAWGFYHVMFWPVVVTVLIITFAMLLRLVIQTGFAFLAFKIIQYVMPNVPEKTRRDLDSFVKKNLWKGDK